MTGAAATGIEAADTGWLQRVARDALLREPAGLGRPILVVRIDEQRLYVVDRGHPPEHYPVSTAANGVGNREGSGQTPLGLHRVARRIGDAAPAGTVFRGRVATGEIAPVLTDPGQHGPGDRITSRILWLEGLEAGHNRGGKLDSFGRYIYIHGTDEEGRIGTPASHGCVRMRNADIIALFPRVPLHSLVLILPDAT
ncbi:L,D-transpeptidase family protein [Thioalkalivibrio sp.]|uniref:L,D-transpeptidase family protein n=1 Tax=Thioalkalivibrio sp. TaxID=2093813 RepID=UPI0035641B7D